MTVFAMAGAGLAALGTLNLAASLASIVLSRRFGRPAGGTTLSCVRRADAPFVSVHVATHDEPPALVIATIEALARLDYPAFEIIVLDNNTADRAVWQPVARRVAELGPIVRFHHREGVRGAKAGALNIALTLTDPRAEYVAVVDADYLVAPDFLSRGIAACTPGVEFVQFPQVYRNSRGATAVVAELSDYFETFPRAANRAQAALLTGTLSIISLAALRSVGGWPTGSITEDAELGVKLWSNHTRGLFLHDQVGNGLLPLDLAGLRLQRQRWVSGNVQTLLGGARAIVATRTGALAVIAQLTAWAGLLGLPLLSLIAVAAVRAFAFEPIPVSWRIVETLAVATILAALAGHLIRALTRQRLSSLAVTMALLWSSSLGWLSVLGPRPLRFRRTPKAAGTGSQLPSLDTVASLVALSTAIAFAVEGAPLTAVTLALSASGLIFAPSVDRWLRTAAARQEPACVA